MRRALGFMGAGSSRAQPGRRSRPCGLRVALASASQGTRALCPGHCRYGHRPDCQESHPPSALRMEIAAAGGDHKALRKLARALLTKAAAGDVHAIREIGDRMDGRVPQAITGDADRDPITVRTIVTGVKREATSEL